MRIPRETFLLPLNPNVVEAREKSFGRAHRLDGFDSKGHGTARLFTAAAALSGI